MPHKHQNFCPALSYFGMIVSAIAVSGFLIFMSLTSNLTKFHFFIGQVPIVFGILVLAIFALLLTARIRLTPESIEIWTLLFRVVNVTNQILSVFFAELGS